MDYRYEWITLNASSSTEMSFKDLIRSISGVQDDFGFNTMGYEDKSVYFIVDTDNDSITVRLMEGDFKVITKIELYLIPEVTDKGNEVELVDVYIDNDTVDEGLDVYSAYCVFEEWLDSILDKAGLKDEADVMVWLENGYNETDSDKYKRLIYELDSRIPDNGELNDSIIHKAFDENEDLYEWVKEKLIYRAACLAIERFYDRTGMKLQIDDAGGDSRYFIYNISYNNNYIDTVGDNLHARQVAKLIYSNPNKDVDFIINKFKSTVSRMLSIKKIQKNSVPQILSAIVDDEDPAYCKSDKGDSYVYFVAWQRLHLDFNEVIDRLTENGIEVLNSEDKIIECEDPKFNYHSYYFTIRISEDFGLQ